MSPLGLSGAFLGAGWGSSASTKTLPGRFPAGTKSDGRGRLLSGGSGGAGPQASRKPSLAIYLVPGGPSDLQCPVLAGVFSLGSPQEGAVSGAHCVSLAAQ